MAFLSDFISALGYSRLTANGLEKGRREARGVGTCDVIGACGTRLPLLVYGPPAPSLI